MAYPGIDIESIFSFHPATAKTGPQHNKVRELLKDTAEELDILVPECPEKTLAIRKLQEAMMFANSAIAQNGDAEAGPETQLNPHSVASSEPVRSGFRDI